MGAKPTQGTTRTARVITRLEGYMILPAKIVKCNCGKLITLNALTVNGAKCPTCDTLVTYDNEVNK